MKLIAYGLITVCLLGMAREAAIALWPENLAGEAQVPLVDYDEQADRSLFEWPLEELTLNFSLTATSPASASTENDLLLVGDGSHESKSYHVSSTEPLALGDQSYSLLEVRPWVGVLPDPGGRPTMSLSIATEENSWVENQPLVEHGHLIVGNTRIQLRPLKVGQSLEGVLRDELSDPTIGRWGIHEGEQVLWFDGFTPGEGAQLNDGTDITLIAFSRSYETEDGLVPAIRIREKKGDVEKDRIVTTQDDDVNVVVESKDPIHHLLDIGVSGMDTPHYILRTLDGQLRTGSLERGKVWQSDILSLWLRFEEYEDKGVFIQQVDSPFVEAVLLSEDRRVRVRQGEAIRVGEQLIRYKRVLPEGAVRFLVDIGDPVSKSIELSSGDSTIFEISGHRCLLRYEDVDLSRGLTILILPTFLWLRFVLFLGLSVGLLMYVRSQTSKSLSKTQNSL